MTTPSDITRAQAAGITDDHRILIISGNAGARLVQVGFLNDIITATRLSGILRNQFSYNDLRDLPAGGGGGASVAAVIAALRALTGNNRLPLSAVNPDDLTELVTALNTLTGTDRLSYLALADAPTVGRNGGLDPAAFVFGNIQLLLDGNTLAVGPDGLRVRAEGLADTEISQTANINPAKIREPDNTNWGVVAGFDATTGLLRTTNIDLAELTHLENIDTNLNVALSRIDRELEALQRGARDIDPVRVVATVNVDINADLRVGQVIDGVNLAAGDRVLVAGQTDAWTNGVYEIQMTGGPARTSDADTLNKLFVAQMFVDEGVAHGYSTWICTIAEPTSVTAGNTNLAALFANAMDRVDIRFVRRFSIDTAFFNRFLRVTGGEMTGQLLLPAEAGLPTGLPARLNAYTAANQYQAIHRKFVVDAIQERAAAGNAGLPEALSLANEDFLTAIHPIDGFRPHISDELSISDVAFQGRSIAVGEALTLQTPLNDGNVWYMLGAPNIINAEFAAGADRAAATDIDLSVYNSNIALQRVVQATDSNGDEQAVTILMSPGAKEIILVTPVNDLTMALHFARSPIPPISRNFVANIIKLKSRVPYSYRDAAGNGVSVNAGDYHTFGGYRFNLTDEQAIEIFTGLTAVGGAWNGTANLYITSLLSLMGGVYRRRLSLSLARAWYEDITVGTANRKIPVPELNTHVKKVMAPETELLRTQADTVMTNIASINNRLNNLIEEPVAVVRGTSLAWDTSNVLPNRDTRGDNFTIELLVLGVHGNPPITPRVTMNGINLSVVGVLDINNGIGTITVQPPRGGATGDSGDRGNIVRSISQRGRVEIGVTLGWLDGRVPVELLVPLFHIPVAHNRPIFTRTFNVELAAAESIDWALTTIASRNAMGRAVQVNLSQKLGFTGLTVGRQYRLWGIFSLRSNSEVTASNQFNVDFRIHTRTNILAIIELAGYEPYAYHNQSVDINFTAEATTITYNNVFFDNVRGITSTLFLREIPSTTITEQFNP